MRKLFLLCAIFLALSAYAQDTKVSGIVKDENNEPVSGASIKIRGTNKGTYTDDKGQFTIMAPANATLEISSVGFNKQEIKVKGQANIEIVLSVSTSSMEDVVVIGYQKITRKKTTAAISSISGKEIENLPAASFDQLMQGRLSGVNVQNFSGDPSAAAAVTVRGNTRISRDWDENSVINGPLYVVDGVPQSNEEYVTPGAGAGFNYLGGVNPNDIESIDVLKDASAAAIYGSRAANGVILITTKKGRVGAPKVIVSGFTGVTERPKLREVTLGALERRQKMAILTAQLTAAQQQQLPYLLTDSLNPAFNGNTNWQDLFYQTGIIKSADLSLSGGTENGTNYRFSTGYYDEEGILKATGVKRYSVRINLGSRALKGKLEINPVMYFTRSERNRGMGVDPRYEDYNPFSLGAGNMPSSLFNLSEAKKEAILGNYDKSLDNNLSNVFNFNLNLGYNFSKSFKFNSLSTYQYTTSRRSFNRTNELENGLGNYSYSFVDNAAKMLTSNYLSYANGFGEHNISVIAGQDIQFDVYENTIASGYYGASDQIQTVNGFTQATIRASSDYQAHGLLSYYARLSYDFKSRYLFAFSGRYDGSSRFGADNKWGFFPSASVAWILSEEGFMKNNSLFSLLKLRASLGTSGSEPTTNYLQYNLYNVNAGGYNGNNNATSYNGVTAVTPNFYDGVAQKNLSWEKSTQWNIGADFEIQQGRYSAAIDVYNREGSLQLFSVRLPLTTGYDYAFTNSYGVRNAGVELTVAANPLSPSSPVKWFTRVNISYNKNTLMSLPNGGRDYAFGNRFDQAHILSIGSPVNAFYLYQTLGVYATDDDVPINKYTGERFASANGAYTAGAFHLADLDGDYLIDIFNGGINPDKTPMGDPNPKITGGWTNNISWKNFSLGLFFSFTFKRDVLNFFKADQFSNSTDSDPYTKFVQYSTPNLDKINIWRQPGDQAEYAKYDLGTYLYYYTSAQTFFLTKGDYFRLKSLNLQYNLGAKTCQKMGIDGLKFFVIADNLLKWQASKDLPDAENVNSYGEYDGNGYPIPRKYTLGFQLQF
ncbi:MAG: hypothetical protein BGP13_00285 [Sphingobacteriales bacterium 40-81]|nr:MAG: hypothetical protein BGP13_00285 [Sphingobacteriales bacterium 40-81]